MRRVMFAACMVLLVIVSSLSLANDPPHNEDSGVDCGACHGEVLFHTDPGSMTPDALKDAYNDMCKRCHTSVAGSYHATTAPVADAHTSAVIQGNYTFITSCIDCHHPHFQDQFWEGRKYYGTEYRLFSGSAISAVPDNDPVRPRTVITYDSASLSPKTGSEWDTTGPPDNDVEVGLAKLAEKTSAGRGAMFLPNTGSPYNSKIIETIDTTADTITVKGTVTSVATAGFAIAYGQVIKRDIPYLIDDTTPITEPVIFLDKLSDNSFANNDTPTGDDTTPNGICQVCHTQTSYWRNDGTGADHNPDSYCIECHSHAAGFLGSGHDDTQFGWSGGCEDCHGAGAAAEAVVAGIHANDCDLCHTTDGPYNADTNKVGDNGDGDATLAEGDAGTWTSTCTTCHNQAQVAGFHGITIVEAASSHNNLGSSRGAWADSGGTIPSNRAASYSGKIDQDTYSGLLDDDYNCADCHDAERTSFTPLEVLEVHDFELGSGNGNCLTCHGASMVADEINAGTGGTGTTVECEDCHSIVNGNGPSGEKMYQYDGIRHHKTVHAQTGNCTNCHADPRPADLSAEPGFAGTAAVNDGVIDNDGITWDDGFDDDFGINYTHPGGMPKQMGCRLCHSNYEEYTVDVKAEIDANWNTDETTDHHGYNKSTNPDYSTSGLTIYTNDFDATGTSLTFRDKNNAGNDIDVAIQIRDAKQTTQTSIASHRIDANDGSSKIDVVNYGTCFSCHTVQIRHAAPIPAQDYDTPVWAIDDAARNTHPYDTLRYSPGRSVFNDFRGGASHVHAWDSHGQSWAWLYNGMSPFVPQDFSGRGNRVFNVQRMATNFNWGSIASSLETVPVNANVNDLESLPGMTDPYNIRNFDTGPADPVIDEITITVAQWTGSAVYVEATSSLGPAQSFSFTYTGAGGPCNTVMTWDIDHYEGTCIAASGWTGTDTVTVFNNTTGAADDKTRVLSDLTINPVLPVLTSISLADNDATDPSPAEAEFTNAPAGEVEVTINASNYPTEMRLSEDSTFNGNTDPWIPYDAITSFTFSNMANEEKKVYCQVRNGAGQAVLQKDDSITLDTVPPTIQTDTLITPNGNVTPLSAEYWPINSSQTIEWDDGDINIADTNIKDNPISLKYSANSGFSYPTTIATDIFNGAGTYTWDPLPSSISMKARVKMIITDKAGNQSEDASDNDFNVSPPDKFIITDTGDTNTLGTLRYALNNMEDNAVLWFKITSTTNEVAEITIDPANGGLPVINNTGVTINGDTQGQLVGTDNPNGPEVRIIKDTGVSVNAFNFSSTAHDGWLENLQIGGFNYAVQSDAENFVVLGCQFGFGSDSTGFDTNISYRNARSISLLSNSQTAYIGAGGSNRNYSCSTTTGFYVRGTNNDLDNNIFGILPDGSTAGCANPTSAIEVNSSSGSSVSNSVICGGSSYGLYISNTDNLTFRGNQVGVYYDGANWIDCDDPGTAIHIAPSSGNSDNVIGGSLVATADNNLRHSNVIDPGTYGIKIRLTSSSGIPTKIYGNYIGTNPEQDETFAGTYGIHLNESSAGAANIGGYDAGEAGNVIANMSTKGVYVDSGATPADYIGINRNSFYNNGTEAALSDDSIFIGSGDNNNIANRRPTIDSATITQITVGGVSSGSIVEVYESDYDGSGSEYGEGRTFIGSATSAGTSVNVDVSGAGLSTGDWITVTNTEISGGRRRTSNFSTNVRVPGAAVPSLDWTGEANYSTDGVDPQSALSGSNFTFRVEYTDSDNDPPSIVEVWIDENDNSSYESFEKYSMTEVNGGDTDYTNGKLYTLTKAVFVAGDNTLNYRFYSSDGASAATGSPTTDKTMTIQPCVNLDVNPAGTYFEAENFTDTIVQGSSIFVQESSVAGYNGTSYLRGSGTNTVIIPPTEEGKQYSLNFTNTGNYRVWLRGRSDSSSTDSIFIGLDGTRTGYLFTSYEHNTWKWISATQTGQPGQGTYYIDPGTIGFHTFNTWFRENNFKIDAVYLTQGTETPTDGTVPSGSTVIDPSVCLDSTGTVAGIATASMASLTSIDVSMPYTYDSNSSNTYTVDYKLSSEPAVWTNWVTAAAHTASPYTTTITGLINGETYDVRMTYNDADGFSGTNPQAVSSIVLPLDATSAGTATALMASLTSIDVSMPYTDDGNGNNTYTVDYKLNSLPDIPVNWTNWVTAAAHAASPYTTTITGLINGETYDVRMTYNDVDGFNGTNPQTVSSTALNYVVTNVNDSGPGSLRQKLTVLIAAGGSDDITFDIPSGLLTNGVAVIDVATNLPEITASDITIDGGSQTTNKGDTNPNGPEVRINKAGTSTTGFYISGDSVYLDNLQITGFTWGVGSTTTANDTSMEYNHLGFYSDSTGYGSSPNGSNASLNGTFPNVYNENYFACATSTGLNISGSSDAYVDGNVFGMYPDGTACANSTYAIRVGGAAADAGITDNIISGSTYGIYLDGSSTWAIIRGNQIGVKYTGVVPTGSWTDLPGPGYGIWMDSGSSGNNTIGGPLVAVDDDTLRNSNVIGAGIYGIHVRDQLNYTTKIHGNFIGTNPDGGEVFSGSIGIYVSYVYGVTIGGADAGEAGNVIANMNNYGVQLFNSSARYVEISRNSFYNNGNNSNEDAIYLGSGPSPGNYPLTRPTIGSASTTSVTVNGVSGGDGGTQAGDIVEVYIADFGGTEYGEGKTFIGSAVVPFGATSVNVPVSGVSSGQYVTAIHTNHFTTVPSYQTSAFSTNVVVP